MDWSNLFTLGGLIVSYSSFQMAWEVIEKKGDYEVAFRWFLSKQKGRKFLPWRHRREVLNFSFFNHDFFERNTCQKY